MTLVAKALGMTAPLSTLLPSNNHKRLFGDSPSFAGEDLGAGDACYVASDGRVMRAIFESATNASAVNDVQTMGVQGDTNPADYLPGSSFVLGYGGQYTAPLNAASGSAVNAAAVQTAINALSSITALSGTFVVTGTFPNFVFTASGGSLAGLTLDLIEVDSSLIDTASQQQVVFTMTHTTEGQPAGSALPGTVTGRVRGFTMMKYKRGQPVSLYDSVELGYSDGNLTPGADLYLSSTTPGALDTAASVTNQPPIAYAMDTQRVFVFAVR